MDKAREILRIGSPAMIKAVRLAAIFFCLMYPSAAVCENITIVPHFSVQGKKENLAVTLTLQNKGDASAYIIVPEIRIGDQRVQLNKIDKMEPNESSTQNLIFTDEKMRLRTAGSYPVFIRVSYEDKNQYRFSINDLGLLHYRSEPLEEKLAVKAEIKAVGDDMFELFSTVNCPGDDTVNGTIQVVLPEEVSCEKTMDHFIVSGEKGKTYGFKIKNRMGLKGSIYRTFVVAQYTYQGKHHTVSAPVLLNITKNPAPPTEYKSILLTFIFIFALAVIVFILEIFRYLK